MVRRINTWDSHYFDNGYDEDYQVLEIGEGIGMDDIPGDKHEGDDKDRTERQFVKDAVDVVYKNWNAMNDSLNNGIPINKESFRAAINNLLKGQGTFEWTEDGARVTTKYGDIDFVFDHIPNKADFDEKGRNLTEAERNTFKHRTYYGPERYSFNNTVDRFMTWIDEL